MKDSWVTVATLGLLLLPQYTTEAATPKDIYSRSRNSVVLIMAYDKSNTPLGLGSGFFIAPKKLVTNHHVIEGAARLVVKNSAAGIQMEVTGIESYSRYLDLAVLTTAAEGTPLTLSERRDYSVGDRVIAIGNPRGLEGSLSEGIISAHRSVDDFTIYQITAPISPGSSGGPLFDDQGKVIGVTTATLSDSQNLNFAVPTWLLTRLHKGGTWEPAKGALPGVVKRGNAGIVMGDFAKRNPYDGEVSFTLRNENKFAVKNLLYLLIYRNVETRSMVHFSIFTDREPIPAGLATRIKQVDRRLEGLTTNRELLAPHLRSLADGVIDAELRVLSYDVEEQQQDDALGNALEKLK